MGRPSILDQEKLKHRTQDSYNLNSFGNDH